MGRFADCLPACLGIGAELACGSDFKAYPHPEERVTLSVTVVVRVKLLLTPVIVNVKVPLEA